MGFLTPDVPQVPKPPNPARNPTPLSRDGPGSGGYSSFVTSSPAGLRRKSDFNKVSLIGGG